MSSHHSGDDTRQAAHHRLSHHDGVESVFELSQTFGRNCAIIYFSKHIACQSPIIQINAFISVYYQIEYLSGIIRNFRQIEKFRIQF
jgi:hypothetical protein